MTSNDPDEPSYQIILSGTGIEDDTTPPAVTIEQASSQTDPTASASIHFSVIFSEPVADFTTGDVTITGTAPGTLVGSVTGSGTTYNVAVSGMTGSGTVIASIAAGKAHDASGNPNVASTSVDHVVTYDAQEDAFVEGFETGNFSALPWQHAATGGAGNYWSIVQNEKHAGSYSARSGPITYMAASRISITLTTNAGNISFWRKVLSEPTNDSLRFEVDGVEKDRWSGDVPWAQATYAVTAAEHTFSWVYTKEGIGTPSGDAAWLDDIVLPSAGPVIASVVVAEAAPTNGKLESNEKLVITWGVTSANGIASQSLTVDGNVVSPTYGPYGGMYYCGVFGPLTAGTHTFTVQATDTQSVPGTYNGTFDVVAVAGPTISSVVTAEATPQNGKLESNEKLVITWGAISANGIASQLLTVDGSAVSPTYGPYGGMYYCGVFGPLTAGTHTFSIQATDAQSVPGTYNGTFDVVAGAGPTISSIVIAEATPQNGKLESNEKLVVTWDVTSADGIASQSVKVDGNTVGPIYGPYGVYYADVFGPLAAGSHSMVIQTTDAQGVSSAYNGTFDVSAVAGPASFSVVIAEATPQNGKLESNEKLVVTWGVTSADGVTSQLVKVDEITVGPIYGPYGVYYADVFGPLAAGSHTVSIQTTDAKGVSSYYSSTFDVLAVQGDAPTIADVVVAEADPPRNGILKSNEKLVISWNLTDADGIASKSLSVDGNAVAPIYGPYGSAYCGVFGPLAAGSHTYAIQATDTKGVSASFNGTLTVVTALTVDASRPPQGPAEILIDAQLAPVVAEAARRWEEQLGSTVSADLAGVRIEVADLPGKLLGEVSGRTIRIDRDAAGYGWFVDSTPADDAEFTGLAASHSLLACRGSASDNRADLLTAVMHEMGHVLGYADNLADDLMGSLLPLGARRTAARS